MSQENDGNGDGRISVAEIPQKEEHDQEDEEDASTGS